MTNRILLEDGTYAKVATPDPQKIVDAEGMQRELEDKQNEFTMYEREIESLIARKEIIQSEIDEINLLIK